MSSIILEICCASARDVVEAEKGGADRVELNSGMVYGGLTPSIGEVEEAKRITNIPIIVMIRPRSGGFCYTDIEFEVMKKDAQAAISTGADGLAFGILNADGTIDIKRNKILKEIAGDKETVFHRAFDVVPNPIKSIDILIEIGINRILTSGQESTVEKGINNCRDIIDHSGGRIEILLGGGIRDYNVKKIIEETGTKQVHLSAFKEEYDNSTVHQNKVRFNKYEEMPENIYQVTDCNKVRLVRNIIDNIAL